MVIEMREWNNTVELVGTVAELPVFSHENHGQVFYRFPLLTERLSGETDRVDILTLAPAAPAPQHRIRVLGQLRSYNNRTGIGARLVISVLANVITEAEGEDENTVHLSGTLCKPPVLRRTPLGRSICDTLLAVNRRYGRSDYLPCIAWGALALEISNRGVGDTLAFQGRIQSREYTKCIEGTEEVRTAYEVSIMHLEEDDA